MKHNPGSRMRSLALSATGAALIASSAAAVPIDVTITNTQPGGGLYLTPLLSIFHDGSFDTFDAGSSASAGVELLAEEGSPAGVIADVEAANTANGTSHTTAVLANPAGFAGAPVLDPGESTTITVDLDPTSHRYFSFLSMVIPSNDTFIGNDDSMAYELFDAMGGFSALSDITVTAGDAWDAGTEADDGNGAAFAPPTATGATDTADPIAALADLDFLIGRPQAPGGTVGSASGVLATISFAEVAPVPLPASFPLLALGVAGLGMIRRRQNR
ncbi:VPLPA-CTERM sorting domain-containing protein [Aliishimia ponticola]|uniref:VPLPA-CTERM sorting domain-containing protein n=1 Tax=Aliishimia ponticola TaxID=2499833 RepID=A0A4V3XKX7_9RHOB|nr:spondin domain-containing protein [Aliishimia ponticola]THH38693.1 VPLPA-CTERM sorting domain-containing protein [Aliishimia ponticola]